MENAKKFLQKYHFLHIDKKSVTKVYEAYFWQVTNIFLYLFNFSVSRTVSSTTFWVHREPYLITCL